MKNADFPAMPTSVDQQEYYDATMDNTVHGYAKSKLGLTKRETIAKDMDISHVEFPNMESLEAFIGCKVDQSNIISMIESGAKATAKLKVMFADALLAELDKPKGDVK